MRKKLSEMTPIEKVDRALKDATWEEAEEAGIEILARCVALHVYALKEGEEYFKTLMERIVRRGDEWAHEGNNPMVLAMASVGHKLKNEKM